jgi:hypothetical protein
VNAVNVVDGQDGTSELDPDLFTKGLDDLLLSCMSFGRDCPCIDPSGSGWGWSAVSNSSSVASWLEIRSRTAYIFC